MRLWIAGVRLTAAFAQAGVVAGPSGGKLLDNEPPRAEFYINAEHRVEIRFFDAELKPVTPAEQTAVVIAEAPSGKVKLDLQKDGVVLTSAEALPEGDGYTIVVQLKSAPDAKNQNFRIVYHAEVCGECNRAEYACTCEHSGEDEHGHGH